MGTADLGGPPPPQEKTIGAIKIKSGKINYIGEENPHVKFGDSGWGLLPGRSNDVIMLKPSGATPTLRHGILGPLHISGMAEARYFKFGKYIDHDGH